MRSVTRTLREPGSDSPVRVHMLGRFAVEIDGAPLRLGSRGAQRPLALLKALVGLGGSAVPELQISEALWPDSDGDRAHWAFATNLHRLRKMLGRAALRMERGCLSINPDDCWVDALAFPRQMRDLTRATENRTPSPADAALAETLSLYAGPFLAGEDLPPAVLACRDRLHDVYLNGVERLGGLLERGGRTDEAIALYRQALSVDERAEAILRRLMLCCRERGLMSEGLAAYRRCRRALRAEFGIEPSPGTEEIRISLLAAPAKPLPLPDKPSLAVLPFENLGGDPAEDFFSDGLTHDVFLALQMVSGLFVSSHGAAFFFKGHPVPDEQICRDLGVQYLLKAGVSRSQHRIRLNARLVDGMNGKSIWRREFDRGAEDLFRVTDEIANEVVSALDARIAEDECARVWRASVRDKQAHESFYRGLDHFWRMTPDSMRLARECFGETIRQEPDSPWGYAFDGYTHWLDFQHGWSPAPEISLRHVAERVEAALSLDAESSPGHSLRGNLALLERQHEEAIREGELSVRYRPNCSVSTAFLANILQFAGRPNEAILGIRHAMRLSPVYPVWFLTILGRAYLVAARYEEAIKAADEAARSDSELGEARIILAAAHAALGQSGQARQAAAEVARLRRGCSTRVFSDLGLYRSADDAARLQGFLCEAGLN